MRPSSQHAPGLPKETRAQIDKTLGEWKKAFAPKPKRQKGSK